jgi:DNA-binding response OmpR family regulator
MNDTNKHLLLIEDDLYTRDLYTEILTGAGFEVESAADGAEGLTKLRDGGYDLVLLDIMLPKLDGIGILNELKKNPPEKPNGPIVVLTNLSRDRVINDALAAGAKECIIKTDVNPDQLVEAVRRHLSASGETKNQEPQGD